MKKDQIIFIDTETTGTEENDRICQIAYKLQGYSEGLSCLFKPPVPISIDAMSITHITNEDVENIESFQESMWKPILKNWFEEKMSVIVAHNASFDLKMLAKESLPMPARHICTMKVAHHYDKEGALQKHNLQFLRYTFGLKFDQTINPHDALSDVIVLEQLFNFYSNFYTIEQMVEISSRPILLKKMPFGKHKGEWFKDILVKDREYMEWMWKSMEMDENMRYTVQHYLKGYHRTNQF